MSGPTQVMVTQRQGADALARDPEDGITHRRQNRGNTRFADAAPFVTTAEREVDRKSTRLNSSHIQKSRMPSSA